MVAFSDLDLVYAIVAEFSVFPGWFGSCVLVV
jgi:hypothetical protein